MNPMVQYLRHECHQYPPHLHGGDAAGVAQRRLPVRWIGGGRPQPLSDQRQPHQHVAAEYRGVGLPLLEHLRDAAGHDQRPGDLDEHRQAVGDVVGVVGRGEPREVHPRPPDGEEHHQVAFEAFQRVSRAHRVVEGVAGLGDRYDEHQVEEQFERRRIAVRLVRRAGRHAPHDRPRGGRRRVVGRGHPGGAARTSPLRTSTSGRRRSGPGRHTRPRRRRARQRPGRGRGSACADLTTAPIAGQVGRATRRSASRRPCASRPDRDGRRGR